jgi:hypothetical protein
MSLLRIVPVGTARGGYVETSDVTALLEEDRNGRIVTRIVLRNGTDVLTAETADEVVERMVAE